MSTVDNLMYAFLSLDPDVFTTHLLFNAHKRNQLTGFPATGCLKWGPMTAMVL